MVQKKIIPIVAGVVIAIIAGSLYFYSPQETNNNEHQWITKGPFSITKSEYRLGENIFLSVNGLQLHESGNVIFITPQGKEYHKIPFDGSLKSNFNNYFKPDTSKARGFCEPGDFVGTWTVVFEGLFLESMSFEVLDEFIPGRESEIVKVC